VSARFCYFSSPFFYFFCAACVARSYVGWLRDIVPMTARRWLLFSSILRQVTNRFRMESVGHATNRGFHRPGMDVMATAKTWKVGEKHSHSQGCVVGSGPGGWQEPGAVGGIVFFMESSHELAGRLRRLQSWYRSLLPYWKVDAFSVGAESFDIYISFTEPPPSPALFFARSGLTLPFVSQK